MRIGVDASCWANRRGYGRFTRSLLEAMLERDTRNDYVFVIDHASLAAVQLPRGLEVRIAAVDRAPTEAAGAHGNRSPRDVLRMTRAAMRARCDAFYFPASYSYYPVPRTPTVVTMHDAIAERLPDLVVPSRRARFLWSLKRSLALRQARAVITVSNASRDALVEVLGVQPEQLTVIREAPAPLFRPMEPSNRAPHLQRFGLDTEGRYVLYVGGISPHKNLPTLVAAFEGVAAEDPDLRLLLVGDTEGDPFLSATATLRETVAASPVRDRIEMTGYVSDDELVALYGGAVALVQPSLGEGFGLTAAEAAACGTPVVASRDPALMELLGDAGLYADAQDASGFAAHLTALLADDGARDRAARACLDRAAGWSWEAAADTTVALLERVAAS